MNLKPPPAAKKARIEIIPLIDVVFFCLATFVLITLTMTKIQGIPVELPQSRSQAPTEIADSVTISVAADGSIYWNKDRMTYDQFVVKIQQHKATVPDPVILINGDAQADFGAAVTILDDCRKVGIKKVSIQTKVAGAPRGDE